MEDTVFFRFISKQIRDLVTITLHLLHKEPGGLDGRKKWIETIRQGKQETPDEIQKLIVKAQDVVRAKDLDDRSFLPKEVWSKMEENGVFEEENWDKTLAGLKEKADKEKKERQEKEKKDKEEKEKKEKGKDKQPSIYGTIGTEEKSPACQPERRRRWGIKQNELDAAAHKAKMEKNADKKDEKADKAAAASKADKKTDKDEKGKSAAASSKGHKKSDKPDKTKTAAASSKVAKKSEK